MAKAHFRHAKSDRCVNVAVLAVNSFFWFQFDKKWDEKSTLETVEWRETKFLFRTKTMRNLKKMWKKFQKKRPIRIGFSRSENFQRLKPRNWNWAKINAVCHFMVELFILFHEVLCYFMSSQPFLGTAICKVNNKWSTASFWDSRRPFFFVLGR